MKLLKFTVSLLFLTAIEYTESESPTVDETAFVYENGSYIRSIKFVESSSHWSNESGTAEFFDRINDKFLDDQAEKSLNTTSFKDIERYIGCGLETFRKSIIGFEKIKKELETQTGQRNESIALQDTNFTLPLAGYNNTVLIEYYNVVLKPFANSSVCHTEPVVPIDENLYITSKCHVRSMVLCGEHNVSMKDTELIAPKRLYGSFCYEIPNVTYTSQSGMSIKAGGSIVNVDLTEAVKFERPSQRNYKSITFSIQFGWWPALGIVHYFGLVDNIQRDYIQSISMQFRQMAKSDRDYLSFQQTTLNAYRQTVVSSIIRLAQLYFQKCDDSLRVEMGGDGGTVKFEKFSRSLYIYPKINTIEWSSFKVDTEIHYYHRQDAGGEQQNLPSITIFDGTEKEMARHSVKSVTFNVTGELSDSAENGLAPELIVKDFDFEFIFTDSASISDDARTGIRWAIKNKIDDYTSSMKSCRNDV